VKQDFRKPLIVMTPKSLLRHKQAVSEVTELADGEFQFVIDDAAADKSAKKLIFCSGKVYYDLIARRDEADDTSSAIVRLEQFYPFPVESLRKILDKYDNRKQLLWVQEESKNRGGWTFAQHHFDEFLDVGDLEYVGRPASASPATGSHNEHQAELTEFLGKAFPGS
jgi:2-oxoglutarate dehydrogenase E1 component